MDRIPLHWIFVLLFLFHNILYFWKTPNFLQLYEWVSLHLIAFHPGIIVTTPCAAYALDRVVPSQRLSELRAGELTAPVAVQNHAACAVRPAGTFKRADAQALFHVVIHGEADNFAVITVQNGGNVERPVRARNLSDIGQPFLIRSSRGKVPANHFYLFLFIS